MTRDDWMLLRDVLFLLAFGAAMMWVMFYGVPEGVEWMMEGASDE